MASPPVDPWKVLVLFGASGTGKSTSGGEIARSRGVAWMQVDDLRLALQSSRVTLPVGTDALYFSRPRLTSGPGRSNPWFGRSSTWPRSWRRLCGWSSIATW